MNDDDTFRILKRRPLREVYDEWNELFSVDFASWNETNFSTYLQDHGWSYIEWMIWMTRT